MDREPKISIIIPVYNVEPYLHQCLEKVTNQTLKEIEIIVVNDATTDNSQKIIDHFAAKDQRIVSFFHKENKGLGAARNTGINNVRGEYIWFIDSDDFIDISACEILYNTAIEAETDILMFSLCTYVDTPSGMSILPESYFTYSKEVLYQKFSSDSSSQKFWEQSSIPEVAFGYISKRKFLNNFRFREGVFHEDFDFSLILFFHATSIFIINYTPYFYRMKRPNSIMQEISPKREKDRLLASFHLMQFCLEKQLSKHHYMALVALSKTEEPIHEKFYPDSKSIILQIKELYNQLPDTEPNIYQKIQAERWYRFGQLSHKRKIWVIAKVLGKKLKIYPLIKPIVRRIKRFICK